jgi:hypothetical protein
MSCNGSEGALMFDKRQGQMFILNDESGALLSNSDTTCISHHPESHASLDLPATCIFRFSIYTVSYHIRSCFSLRPPGSPRLPHRHARVFARTVLGAEPWRLLHYVRELAV